MIALRGLKETNAAIVGMPDQLGELLLPKFALHPAAMRAGSEREPGYLDVGLAEGDPIGSGSFRGGRGHRAATDSGKHGRRNASLEKITSS